jgi:hypothetical protein
VSANGEGYRSNDAANAATATTRFSDHVKDSVVLLLLYGGLGPLIGLLILSVPLAAIGIFAEGFLALGIFVFALPLSYLFGAIPALACGAVASWASWRGRAISYAAIATTGAGATFVFAAYWVGFNSLFGFRASQAVSSNLLFALIGSAAAVICRRVGRKLHEPAPISGRA